MEVFEYIFSLWGMIIVCVVFSSLASMVAVIAKHWSKARRAEIEASLKAELIKQNRSADEIERILSVRGRGSDNDA